jgi:hypothetical protein
MEMPVKRILMGVPAAKAADVASLAEPGALDFFVRFARRMRKTVIANEA